MGYSNVSASSTGSATAAVFISPPPPGTSIYQGAMVMNTGAQAGYITFDGWFSKTYLPAGMSTYIGEPCNASNLANVQIQSASSTGMSGVVVKMVP
jgi:hypothetical protein